MFFWTDKKFSEACYCGYLYSNVDTYQHTPTHTNTHHTPTHTTHSPNESSLNNDRIENHQNTSTYKSGGAGNRTRVL